MRFISTKTHGYLDFLTAGTLLALPRAMGWSDRVRNLMTGAAVGAVGYSLLTRYEMGVVRILPMPVHLALDGLSGAMLAAAPLLMPDEDDGAKQALLGLGLFEIAAALTTRTEPGPVPSDAGGRMGAEAAARRGPAEALHGGR